MGSCLEVLLDFKNHVFVGDSSNYEKNIRFTSPLEKQWLSRNDLSSAVRITGAPRLKKKFIHIFCIQIKGNCVFLNHQ